MTAYKPHVVSQYMYTPRDVCRCEQAHYYSPESAYEDVAGRMLYWDDTRPGYTRIKARLARYLQWLDRRNAIAQAAEHDMKRYTVATSYRPERAEPWSATVSFTKRDGDECAGYGSGHSERAAINDAFRVFLAVAAQLEYIRAPVDVGKIEGGDA